MTHYDECPKLPILKFANYVRIYSYIYSTVYKSVCKHASIAQSGHEIRFYLVKWAIIMNCY